MWRRLSGPNSGSGRARAGMWSEERARDGSAWRKDGSCGGGDGRACVEWRGRRPAGAGAGCVPECAARRRCRGRRPAEPRSS